MVRVNSAILAIIVSLAGCSSERDNLVRSFKSFSSLASHVTAATNLTLYEGLPPQFERALFDQESNRKDKREFDGHFFYATPISISAETQSRIKKICTDQELYKQLGAPKSCGGFHPDWRITCLEGDREISLEFCFTCNEFQVLESGKVKMLCEMKERGEIEAVLNPLHVNRPKSASNP